MSPSSTKQLLSTPESNAFDASSDLQAGVPQRLAYLMRFGRQLLLDPSVDRASSNTPGTRPAASPPAVQP